MSKLAKSLQKESIDYCVLGGNALQAHGYDRATTDIDVLMTREGLDKFVDTHLGRGYARRFEGAKTKFRNTMDNVPIDVLLSGSFPGDGQSLVPFPHPKDISYAESYFGMEPGASVQVVDLKNLINLKLLSYNDLRESRMQDFVDVCKLVELNGLSEELAEELHPSVQELFLKARAVAHDQKKSDAYPAR